MGGFSCRAMPVDLFNRMAKSQDIAVVSRDNFVDRRDTFERRGQGESEVAKLTFRSEQVQSIMSLWRSDCHSLKRRAESPELKEVARAFGVRLGPPVSTAEGEAERLGVYKKRRHLFDVDASSEADAVDPAPSAQLTAKQLARLIAEGLGAALPSGYRARVEISGGGLSTLEDMGVRIDPAREEIIGPSGEIFRYGGSRAVGFTVLATIEALSETSLRVTMQTEDGQERTALFPLKAGADSVRPGPAQGPIANDPYGGEDSEEPEEIRASAERGAKKRTITGPGISVTVYE